MKDSPDVGVKGIIRAYRDRHEVGTLKEHVSKPGGNARYQPARKTQQRTSDIRFFIVLAADHLPSLGADRAAFGHELAEDLTKLGTVSTIMRPVARGSVR